MEATRAALHSARSRQSALRGVRWRGGPKTLRRYVALIIVTRAACRIARNRCPSGALTASLAVVGSQCAGRRCR